MDNIVDVIFAEDFSLTDGMESDLVCGDGIHALLGESVLRCTDAMTGHVDEESSSETASEEEHVDDIDRVVGRNLSIQLPLFSYNHMSKYTCVILTKL